MICKILLSIVLTLVIIFVVPFPVYGLFSVAGLVETPEDAAVAAFMLGVLVSKVGTAIGFVLLFYAARSVFSDRWMTYAFLWWLMSAIHEVGQSIGPGYAWMEGIAGIISETVYFPLAAFVTCRLLGAAVGSGVNHPVSDHL